MADDLPLLGFGLPVAGAWATPDTMVRVARRAEDLGYAALWTFQRLLYPVDPEPGGLLDAAHHTVQDSVVALSYVAGHTTRIGLGTATLCAPFTAPVSLAKTMASLDVVSGGRLSVGLGSGWMRQEYTAAGVPFGRRGARLDEYLRCVTALWTQDPVEFDGEFYTVPPSHLRPRPVQQLHPPLLLGGTAAPALRRAGRLAQGWIGSSRQEPEQVRACVDLVREGARDAGRDPDAVRILVRCLVDPVDTDPGRDRRPFHGTHAQIVDDLAALRSRGVTEAFLDLNLSPHVGHPGIGADEGREYAEQVLEAFAPGGTGRPRG